MKSFDVYEVLFITISEFTPKSNEITWRTWAPFVIVPTLENADQCDDISVVERDSLYSCFELMGIKRCLYHDRPASHNFSDGLVPLKSQDHMW
jgi:hypothetical protein